MKRFYSTSLRLFDVFGRYFAFRNLPYLQKIEYSQSQAKRFQRGMLKILMEHAYDHVPYYHDIFRKLNLNPHYQDPYALLQKLPILTKDVVRQQYSQLISNYPTRYKVAKTSGSSGVPLKILRDYAGDGLAQASYYEGLSWYGYDIGDPIVQLWGRRPVPTRKQQIVQIKNRITNFYELNANSMSDDTIGEYIKKIHKIRPKVLYGYVSAIELLCKYMKEHRLRTYIPTVVTTAEKLFSFQRDMISSTLALEVYDQYGSSEVTSAAFECPSHTCLHVMPRVILDIVETHGEKCTSGEAGRILLTDLANYKMPFIKYEVGDLATGVEEADCCTCGRKLTSIKNIEGRTSDIIVGLNGNRVYGEFFAQLFQSSGFAEFCGLRQFQVIQKTTDLLLIRLNTEFAPTDKTMSYLDMMIKKYLGPIEIHFEFLPDIPIHSTGKRSSVISEL
jgi:phenylacetate-CoA ligase